MSMSAAAESMAMWVCELATRNYETSQHVIRRGRDRLSWFMVLRVGVLMDVESDGNTMDMRVLDRFRPS
jgi:hypothetical protein